MRGGPRLSWDDPKDDSITGYRILRRETDRQAPGVFTTINEDTGSARTAYTDGTVEPETRYVYRVKAINAHGVSGQSNYADADTPAEPQPTSTPEASEPPAAPQNLISAAAHDHVILSWGDPKDDSITGYRILRRETDRQDPGVFTTIDEDTGSGDNSYTDSTVAQETRYVYRVKAINAHGLSAQSNDARANTPAEPRTARQSAVPGAPTVSSVADGGYGSLAVAWSAPVDNGGDITAYDVRHILSSATDKADDNWTVVDDAWTVDPGGALEYTIAGLTPGENHDVQVRAVNSDGDGGWSPTSAAAAGTFTLVPYSWSLRPADIGGGDNSFRLLFVTSQTLGRMDRPRQSTTRSYRKGLRRATATFGPTARNSRYWRRAGRLPHGTTPAPTRSSDGEGEPIYWLNGPRVADDYADFYDGWDNSNPTRTESGASVSSIRPTDLAANRVCVDGHQYQRRLHRIRQFTWGRETPRSELLSTGGEPCTPTLSLPKCNTLRFYGLSGVFRVDPSTDPTLSSLTVSPGDIVGFASDRVVYFVRVASTVTQVTITAEPTDPTPPWPTPCPTPTATPTATRWTSVDGRVTVNVKVTAQEGTTKTYTVNVEQAQPISLDVKTPGELEEAGEEDWFSVTLTAGKFYMFEGLGGEAGTTPYQIRHGTLRYPHIRLYDAAGQGVVDAGVRVDSDNYDDTNGRYANWNANLWYAPTATGPYYVQMSSSGTGTYTVRVRDVTISESTDEPDGEDFANGFQHSGALAVNDEASGRFDSRRSTWVGNDADMDFYRVNLQAGTEYSFTVVASGISTSLCRAYIEVRSYSGLMFLAYNPTFSPGSRDSVTFTPRHTGSYIVSVSNTSTGGCLDSTGDKDGTYTVGVTD